MKRLLSILLFIIIPTIVLGGDYNFKRKKVYPKLSDTTNVFVLETKVGEIYFSQNDIIANIDNFEDSLIYKDLLDTLSKNTKLFHLRSDTIYDKIYERDLGNNCIIKGEFPSGKDIRDRINIFISYLAADLIIQEKFLLKIKPDTSFYDKKVLVKMEDGLMGSEYLSFYCRRNIRFLHLAWALGE